MTNDQNEAAHKDYLDSVKKQNQDIIERMRHDMVENQKKFMNERKKIEESLSSNFMVSNLEKMRQTNATANNDDSIKSMLEKIESDLNNKIQDQIEKTVSTQLEQKLKPIEAGVVKLLNSINPQQDNKSDDNSNQNE